MGLQLILLSIENYSGSEFSWLLLDLRNEEMFLQCWVFFLKL